MLFVKNKTMNAKQRLSALENRRTLARLVKRFPHQFHESVCGNPGFTYELKPLLKSFSYRYYSECNNWSLDQLEREKDEAWNWKIVSQSPNIRWTDVCTRDLPWKMIGLCLNPNLLFETVKNNLFMDWNFTVLSSNPNITMEVIEDNPGLPWCWEKFASGPNCTYQVLQKYRDRWDYEVLSRNPYLDWRFLKEHPDLPWNYGELSRYAPLTLVEELIDKPWSYQLLSMNEQVTWKFVKKHRKEEWQWDVLSKNPDVMENQQEEDLHPYYMSLNPRLTYEQIVSSLHRPWRFHALAQNEFEYHEIRQLKPERERELYRFIKDRWYWPWVERAHSPEGYYGRKDLEWIANNCVSRSL